MSATISLVLFQVISRVFSFGMNQVLLRSSTPLAVGTAMSLDLTRDTVLFTIREPIRGAFLVSEQRKADSDSRPPVMLMWRPSRRIS